MTFLVTTADTRAWPADDAVVLWRSCLGPAGQEVLRARKWRMASAFYPDVRGRLDLVAEAASAYESVMPRLASALNAWHGLTYTRRQWEIMVGPFLTRYVRVVMNRYLKLERCVAEDGVSASIHLRRETDAAPADTLHLIFLTEDDAWNHQVCIWFLRDFFPTVRVETHVVPEPYQARVVEQLPPRGLARRTLERIRARRAVYVNDLAASRPLKLGFYLASGQGWLAPKPLRLNAPLSDRSGLSLPAPDRPLSGHRDAIDRYLFRLLPKCYIETFPEYRREVERDRLAERRRVMITSTAFDADECFKMKVADEVGRGGRYVVFQHGAVYGVNPFFADTVEERTSDAFVTWGWTKNASHVPGFCLTTPSASTRRRRPEDRMVLVTLNQRRKKFLWDVEPEFDAYMNAQFDFIDALGPLRDRLTIRLHAAHVRSLGREKDQFMARYPGVAMDLGHESIWKSIGRYRLAIFTYDSSGLLEMLSLNAPVVGFWNADGFDQVGGDAAPYYDLLRNAGIVQHSPADLAAFVTARWSRIEAWWASEEVQSARERFCARYAAPPPKRGGTRHLRRLILQQRGRTAGVRTLSPEADRA